MPAPAKWDKPPPMSTLTDMWCSPPVCCGQLPFNILANRKRYSSTGLIWIANTRTHVLAASLIPYFAQNDLKLLLAEGTCVRNFAVLCGSELIQPAGVPGKVLLGWLDLWHGITDLSLFAFEVTSCSKLEGRNIAWAVNVVPHCNYLSAAAFIMLGDRRQPFHI